jgi:hypothetical protein
MALTTPSLLLSPTTPAGVGVRVGVRVAVTVGVLVGVAVGVTVGVGVRVNVAVGVGVSVGVAVGVSVGVGVRVGVGVCSVDSEELAVVWLSIGQFDEKLEQVSCHVRVAVSVNGFGSSPPTV